MKLRSKKYLNTYQSEKRLTTQAQRRLGDGAAAAQAADVTASRRSLQRLVRRKNVDGMQTG